MIKLYILCHNAERFAAAKEIYSKYSWAVPIRMKYQDATQENAFWRQLLEIESEWADCEMVGTLSSVAHKKINLDAVDAVIRSKHLWETTGYFHFHDTTLPLSVPPHDFHPHLRKIAEDILHLLGLPLPTENWCNYFMARPAYMKEFIYWFFVTLKPLVMNHPLSYTHAHYNGAGTKPLEAEECIARFGVPYYPHHIFVFERLNKVFFTNREAILASRGPGFQKMIELPKKQETDS